MTGDQSKEDLRYAQRPLYFLPFFVLNIYDGRGDRGTAVPFLGENIYMTDGVPQLRKYPAPNMLVSGQRAQSLNPEGFSSKLRAGWCRERPEPGPLCSPSPGCGGVGHKHLSGLRPDRGNPRHRSPWPLGGSNSTTASYDLGVPAKDRFYLIRGSGAPALVNSGHLCRRRRKTCVCYTSRRGMSGQGLSPRAVSGGAHSFGKLGHCKDGGQ